MNPRTTLLLLLLNATLAIVAGATFLHFTSARANAQRDRADASAVLADLEQISATRHLTEGGQPSQQITTILQSAASAAGIAEHLQSVEAGSTRSDHESPALSIRLSAVTLDQLQIFLRRLSQSSPPLLSGAIHLGVPRDLEAAKARGGETWTAEISLRADAGGAAR